MSEVRTSDGKYHIEIRDARGVVIGDNNVVYQYFLDERYRPLAEHLITFDDLITERTADFVGRAFLDARLATFMEQHDRGYFVLVGEPGIGKTAWAAHVVREHQALHHFNVSAMGIVRPDQALENLCAQIIARFQLDQPYLPVNAGRDGSLLDKLLRQAAERLTGSKLVIVIDALDEAQMPADVRGTNAIYLPSSLPLGVYFVLTRRPQPVLLETAPGTSLEVFALGADLPANQADVRAYLHQQATRPEIAVRLADRHIVTEHFVEELAERSAGNFMYLAYLLPDIATGLLDPLNLTGLPQGLRGYYERFWNELESAKGEGREAWTKLYKPVIGMLAAAREPVSVAWIGRILGLDPDEVADFALVRWRKFLYRADVAGEARWQLYHASFADFLEDKLDGAVSYHGQIADYYRVSCDYNWVKLTDLDDAYGLRHVATHLAGARWWEDLHNLVAEGTLQQLPWAQARFQAEGDYGGFLADLALAWNHASETAPEADEAASRQIRYALITSSLFSLITRVPVELLVALLENNMPGWTLNRVLGYLSYIPRSAHRNLALMKVAPLVVSEVVSEVQSGHGITWTDENLLDMVVWLAELLSTDSPMPEFSILVQTLPEAMLANVLDQQEEHLTPSELFRFLSVLTPHLSIVLQRQAVRIAGHFKNEEERADLLMHLTRHLAPELYDDVLDLAKSIREEEYRGRVLAYLASFMAKYQPMETLEFAMTIDDSFYRANALAAVAPMIDHRLRRQVAAEAWKSLWDAETAMDREQALSQVMPRIAPYLLASHLTRAIEYVTWCADSEWKANVLKACVPQVPPEQLDQAVTALRTLESAEVGAEILAFLIIHFSMEQQREILISAKRVDNPCIRARTLAGLASNIAPALRESALTEVFCALDSIESPLDYGMTLNQLTTHLPSQMITAVIDASLTGILAAVGKTEPSFERDKTLLKFAQGLPEDIRKRHITEIINAAAVIPDGQSCARALAGIAAFSSAEERKQVLTNALLKTQEVGDTAVLAESLARLVPDLESDLAKEVSVIVLHSMQSIFDEGALAGLLVRTCKYLHQDVRMQVLQIAETLTSPAERAWALAGLVPDVPPEVRAATAVKVLDMIDSLSINDGFRNWCLWALDQVTPYLTTEQREKAADGILSRITRIEDDVERRRCLIDALRHVPDSLMRNVFEVANSIGMESQRAEAFVGIGPRCASELLKEILDTVKQMRFPYWGTVVSGLAPCLPSELIDDALNRVKDPLFALAVGDTCEFLIGVAPRLTPKLLVEAMSIAESIPDEGKRIRALMALAPQMTPAQRAAVLRKGLRIAAKVNSRTQQARLLLQLVPGLRGGTLRQAVETILAALEAIGSEDERVNMLVLLGPYLFDSSRNRALSAIAQINLDATRACKLADLLNHLPAPIKKQKLEQALTSTLENGYGFERHHKLMKLLPQLPFELQIQALDATLSQVLERSFWGSDTVGDHSLLFRELGEIAPHWVSIAQQDPQQAYTWWKSVLPRLASRSRGAFLEDLIALLPITRVLVGSQGISVMVRTILDIGRWWP